MQPQRVSLPPPFLEVQGLSKQFGRRVLFRGLDVTVGSGEALAITGPNGSGKSTLLMVLAGLLSPSAGAVRLRLGASAVGDDERALRVGFVAPYLNVYDELSARENLLFLGRARRLPQAELRIAELLRAVGLEGRGDDLLKTYSSGMRQRVVLAAALLPRPSLLLLDEPGSSLDVAGRELVDLLVRQQLDAGGAVVLATNSEAEARLCERRVELGGGLVPRLTGVRVVTPA